MPDQTFDPNQPFTVENEQPIPQDRPFRDEDFPEYQRLVRSRTTTPAQLSNWLESRGYGRSSNAAEVLTFARRNPNARIENSYIQNTGTPTQPAPNGNPQPGTPTDWLPDSIQAGVERLGLSMGLIDPSTYYGLGNYGENAVRPNRQTTISNPTPPSWVDRVARSMRETFSNEGSGINAYLLRSQNDARADQFIRSYGSEHNWTSEQIDAAIRREREDRSRAIEEVRNQRRIRDNDEVRREEGLGLNPDGTARSSWGGWLRRGSADLAGAIVGDANPTYVLAPEVRGVQALTRAAAPVAERVVAAVAPRAAPIVEHAVAAAAPTVGRMAGQGVVQGGTNTVTQADEVQRGLRENIDPAEVGVHTLLGATFQGGAEALGKLAPNVARWITSRGGRVEGTVAEPAQLSQLDQDLALLAERGTDITSIGSVEKIHQAANDNPVLTRNPRPKLLADNDTRVSENNSDNFFQVQPLTQKEAWDAADLLADEFGLTPEQVRQQMGKDFPENWATERATTPNETPDNVAPQEAAPAGPEPVSPDAAPVPNEGPAPADAGAAPEAPQFEGDVVQRLTAAINDAGKLSREQAALLSQSRSEKLQGVLEARATSSGEAGLSSEMAQLRGEAPKVDYEGVRGQFTQEEIDRLFDSIKQNPSLSLFDSINARTGLAKLLDGTVPTRSEINLLSKVFPADFVRAALRHRSTSAKIADFAGNALNLPRSLMSTLDLSAPMRQGVFLSGRREFYNAFGSMFKQFGSERVYRGVMDDIKARDTYPLMEESGLALSDMGHDLSQREEAFMSQWAERIPGVGRVVRASERGFSGFLNKLRADTFDDLVRRSVAAGVDFKANPKALSDIASFVNAATGRGSLGKLNSSAPLLNGLFFSPRLIASRVQMLNPAYYATLSPVVRREAVKSLLTFGTLATSILTLAHMGGADVEADPRSSDFGKIKIGNTRYDILGGFGQYITLGARLAMNETKTLKGEVQTLGERYGSRTRLDTAGNFLANKASPVAGYVRDYLRGADPVGNPFDARKDAAQLFIPLFLQDAYAVMQDGGVEALPRVAPGFFGVGVQTYTEKPKFDHNQPFTQEVAAEPAPTSPAAEATFDPNQPFETTTQENLQAANILTNMGLHITDEGVRSEADQERYYNTTQGAAAPGTSSHQDGNAIDVRVPRGVRPSDIVAELTASGFRGVSIITKRHGTGPHWHIQWQSAEE